MKKEELYKHGAQKLLRQYYNDSLYQALSTVYPTCGFVPWSFQEEPVLRGYWNQPHTHRFFTLCFIHPVRQFFDWLGVQLKYKKLDDWYFVTAREISMYGGAALLNSYYGDSPFAAVSQSVSWRHNWLPWKFATVPNSFWAAQQNQRRFFDWLALQLGFKSVGDWYAITRDHIYNNGGAGLLSEYYGNSPSAALSTVFPEHKWMPWKFSTVPKRLWTNQANQRQLFDWIELNGT